RVGAVSLADREDGPEHRDRVHQRSGPRLRRRRRVRPGADRGDRQGPRGRVSQVSVVSRPSRAPGLASLAMSSIARTAATGGALDPEFLAWQTSLPVDRRLLEVDVAGSVAHVEGLVAGGLLSREEGDTLQAALRSLPGKVARGEV